MKKIKQMKLIQGRKPTKKQLLVLVDLYAGNMSEIGRVCGVSRQAVRKWRNADPKLKEAIDAGNVVLVDLAVVGLKHHLKKKSEKIIMFTLDRLGRDKGFGRLIQIQDKSKFEDQFEDKTDAELLELLEKTNQKLKDG